MLVLIVLVVQVAPDSAPPARAVESTPAATPTLAKSDKAASKFKIVNNKLVPVTTAADTTPGADTVGTSADGTAEAEASAAAEADAEATAAAAAAAAAAEARATEWKEVRRFLMSHRVQQTMYAEQNACADIAKAGGAIFEHRGSHRFRFSCAIQKTK